MGELHPVPVTQYVSLANWWFQPLTHLSVAKSWASLKSEKRGCKDICFLFNTKIISENIFHYFILVVFFKNLICCNKNDYICIFRKYVDMNRNLSLLFVILSIASLPFMYSCRGNSSGKVNLVAMYGLVNGSNWRAADPTAIVSDHKKFST